MKVRPEDGVNIGLCSRGQVRFCRMHDLDVHRFFREGLEFSEVEHIDDENVRLMLEQARLRELGNGQA